MSKKFTRKIESFKCLNCNNLVDGNGYTNHCPDCLWSRHVDINPGDRSHSCKGAMEPISYEKKSDNIKIIHKCASCGEIKKNKLSDQDNIDLLFKINLNKIT